MMKNFFSMNGDRCYDLCLEAPPKPHAVIGGSFSGMVGFIACDTIIDSWYSAKVKGTRIRGVSATCTR